MQTLVYLSFYDVEPVWFDKAVLERQELVCWYKIISATRDEKP